MSSPRLATHAAPSPTATAEGWLPVAVVRVIRCVRGSTRAAKLARGADCPDGAVADGHVGRSCPWRADPRQFQRARVHAHHQAVQAGGGPQRPFAEGEAEPPVADLGRIDERRRVAVRIDPLEVRVVQDPHGPVAGHQIGRRLADADPGRDLRTTAAVPAAARREDRDAGPEQQSDHERTHRTLTQIAAGGYASPTATQADNIRRAAGAPPLGRARALQHRHRRVRQAPARQARDGVGGLARETSAASSWGELQDLAAKCANVLRDHGVERGDRVAMLLPPTPETAAMFFGTWKLGAILLSMSVLYGDEGIRHRIDRLAGEGPRHRRRQRRPGRSRPRRARDRARRPAAGGCVDQLPDRRHGRRRPGAALLLVRHDRPREGHPARAPLHPRPRGVRLLPRPARRRAVPRHGGVGLGRRHRAVARPLAAGGDAVRVPARRAASTPSSSSPCSPSTARRTSSRPPPRCGR